MALRNRIGLGIISNQENVKKIEPLVNGLPGKTKRAALGEIGNNVNLTRGVKPVDKTSLLPKEGKQPLKKPTVKVTEKIIEKPPVQIVKPVVKKETQIHVEPTKQIVVHVTPKNEKKVVPQTPPKVENIDEDDKDNLILVSIYSNDIYEHLRYLERKYPVKKGFLDGQEVTPKMRSVLIDWLVEVHEQFHLLQETLYLTVAIIDRFLQVFRSIDRKRLQLVGVSAMFIASKYEEIYSPDVKDFVYITDNAYSKEEILQMEKLIAKTLDFSFGRPLPLQFLRRYSKAGKAAGIHHTMGKYFLEQSLVHYEMCHYPPSLIAAAAIYLAFLLVGSDDNNDEKLIWTSTLVRYSTYSMEDVLPVVKDIAKILVCAEISKQQAVRIKYSGAKYMKISARPELRSPVLIALSTRSKKEEAA